MDHADIHPLLPPADWWTIIAVLGLVIAAGLLLWPVFRALWRRGTAKEGETGIDRPLRQSFLTRIGGIEEDLRSGGIDERTASQRLGLVVREFFSAAWGVDTAHMTLQELRAHRLDPAASLIGRMYDAEFGRENPTEIDGFFTQAKELVSTWS